MEDNELSIIQVLCKKIEYGELEKLKVDVFGIKGKVPAKKYTRIKRLSRYLPMSSDTINYGIPLKVTTNNKVDSVLTLVKNPSGEYIYFIENKKKNNAILKGKIDMPLFNRNKLFYQNNVEGIDYILVTEKIGDNKTLKEAYSVGGFLIEKVEDIDMLNNSYIRKFGKYTLLIFS